MDHINFLEDRSFRLQITGLHVLLGFLITMAIFVSINLWQNKGWRQEFLEKSALEEELQVLRAQVPLSQEPATSGHPIAIAYEKQQKWATRLRLITNAIPPSVRLNSISLKSDPESLVTLKGFALSLEGLGQLKEKLSLLAVTSRVSLLSSNLDKEKTHQHSFEMEIRFK